MKLKSKTQLSYKDYNKELRSYASTMENGSSDTPAEKKNVRTTTKKEEKKPKGKIKISHIEGLLLNEKGYVSYDRWKDLSAEQKTKVLEKRKAILEDKSREFARYPKYKDRSDTPKPSNKDKGEKVDKSIIRIKGARTAMQTRQLKGQRISHLVN